MRVPSRVLSLSLASLVTACSSGSPAPTHLSGSSSGVSSGGTSSGSSGSSSGGSTGSSSGSTGFSEAKSSLPRDSAPSVSTADQQTFEDGNAAFALAMYAQLPHASSNLFFSPYSMSSALAMAYAGAVGTTATEMATALHFTLPAARLHPAFDWLDLQLASRAGAATANQGQPFALSVANSLWADKTESIEMPFLDILAVDYGAGVRLVDFIGQPDPSRVAINGWVSDQTNMKIPDLFSPGMIKDTTRFVIVNAIYFKANWASEFQTFATAPAAFTKFDGSTEQVPTMNQTTTYPYAAGAGWQAVELPYDGNQVAMDVVLPAAGSDAQLDSSLDSTKLAAIVGALQPTSVALALPKFQIAGATIRLKAQLEALGMQTAFGAGADFSAMTPDPVAIDDVVHQAYINVDEHGTEAAAATGVIFADAGVALEASTPIPMTVDRPFFIAIRDVPTNTILFAGKVVDPAN